MRFLISSLLTALLITPAVADPLPEKWQSRREAMNKLGDAACTGDTESLDKLMDALKDGDPVAMNEVRWLYQEEDCESEETKQWRTLAAASYTVTAAEMGYPIAASNLAGCMIWDQCDGIPHDVETGLYFAALAISGGYGLAAYNLGMQLTEGSILEPNLEIAKILLNIAILEGVDRSKTDRLDTAWNKAMNGETLATPALDLSPEKQRILFAQVGYQALIEHYYESVVAEGSILNYEPPEPGSLDFLWAD
ncbi:SEL1-like repeat protein [Celeribacter sp. ULVN23_4]